MVSGKGKSAENPFKEFVGDGKVLIVDESAAARASISKALKQLEIRNQSIIFAPSYDAAVQEVSRVNPRVILTEYQLGAHCGLKLIHQQRDLLAAARLFVVITANSGEAAIAEAAEEEVDSYILKPFTISILNEHLLAAAEGKLNPTAYRRTIEEGKALLLANEAKLAAEVFLKAIPLHERPALAYFYHGKTCVISQDYPQAEISFHGGLRYNERHYRCLTGLYDLLTLSQRYEEAYQIARKITQTFPVSPQRLDSIVRLAIQTRAIEDLGEYYLNYVSMDYRTPELTKVLTAALVIAGRYYLGKGQVSEAVGAAKRGLITSGRSGAILKEIIALFVKYHRFDEAGIFLREFPPEVQGEGDYLAMELLVLSGTGTSSQIIERGRRIIEGGVHDPLIYEILISRSKAAGLDQAAEGLAYDAAKRWPLSRERFLALLNAGDEGAAGALSED